jgi:YgiT-type zinc finger domain-containing protein
MRCMYCQAEMKKGTTPFHIDRQGIHISLDDVPAWVCPQCGESYFEEKDVDTIQGLIKAVEEQAASFSQSP